MPRKGHVRFGERYGGTRPSQGGKVHPVPTLPEKAKRTWLPTTIQGLVLVGISAFIISLLTV